MGKKRTHHPFNTLNCRCGKRTRMTSGQGLLAVTVDVSKHVFALKTDAQKMEKVDIRKGERQNQTGRHNRRARTDMVK